jgi:tetratricopeptide (TPR) repeat protein
LKPDYYEAYSIRGLLKYELGNKQAALADYDLAIALNRKSPTTYYNRGLTKSELGDNQGAINDLTQAAELFKQQGQLDLANRTLAIVKQKL